MKQALQLIRNNSTIQGVTGLLWANDFRLNTIELPWKDNQRDISCIPVGRYDVIPYNSPLHGSVFLVKAVPDRGSIEFHILNWAGDAALGYRTDSEGCIGVGTSIGEIAGQTAILRSASAMKLLLGYCDGDGFSLHIVWQAGL